MARAAVLVVALIFTLPAPALAAGLGPVSRAARLPRLKRGNVSTKRLVRNHGVTEITFRRTGCLGQCPAFSMHLTRAGKASYQGQAYVKRQGKYQATIHRWRFDLLASLLVRGGFFQMDKRYERPVTCQSSAIVGAKRRGRWHRVVDYGHVGPVLLWAMQQALDHTAAELSWKLRGTPRKKLTPKRRAKLRALLLRRLRKLTVNPKLAIDSQLDGRARRTREAVRRGRVIHAMVETARHDGARVRIGGCAARALKVLEGYRKIPTGLSRVGLAIDTAPDGRRCLLLLAR